MRHVFGSSVGPTVRHNFGSRWSDGSLLPVECLSVCRVSTGYPKKFFLELLITRGVAVGVTGEQAGEHSSAAPNFFNPIEPANQWGNFKCYKSWRV